MQDHSKGSGLRRPSCKRVPPVTSGRATDRGQACILLYEHPTRFSFQLVGRVIDWRWTDELLNRTARSWTDGV